MGKKTGEKNLGKKSANVASTRVSILQKNQSEKECQKRDRVRKGERGREREGEGERERGMRRDEKSFFIQIVKYIFLFTTLVRL
jgi:hypothetical protein